MLESTTHQLLILQMIGNSMSDGSSQSIVESYFTADWMRHPLDESFGPGY